MSHALSLDWREDLVIITLGRDLGEFAFYEFKEEIEAAERKFEVAHERHVIINCRDTDYFGSSAMGFFARLWKQVRLRGGGMVFCELSEHEKELLNVAGLDTLWPARSTLEQAISAIGQEIGRSNS